MLAYVLWHWKTDRLPADRYEALAREFHSALRQNPPPGFLRAFAFGVEGAPWVPEGRAAYEDWYVLEGSGALDPLDRAAVEGSRKAPHDAVAGAVAGGAGGLYRLRAGAPLADAARAFWLAKPAGMSYAAFDAALAPLAHGGEIAVWCRQMVLGPAPEFCLHSRRPLDVPAPLEGVSLALRGLPA